MQLGLIDAGSSTRSLSVLLSAMETSLRTQITLETAQWAWAGIISTRICVLCVLAAANIRGRRLFAWSLWLCDYYLKVASNQKNAVFSVYAYTYVYT